MKTSTGLCGLQQLPDVCWDGESVTSSIQRNLASEGEVIFDYVWPRAHRHTGPDFSVTGVKESRLMRETERDISLFVFDSARADLPSPCRSRGGH